MGSDSQTPGLDPSLFRTGDRVRHAGRPQWGIGRVERANREPGEGRTSQTVEVTFPNHGRVTLQTSVARLERVSAEARGGMEPTTKMTQTHDQARFLADLKKLPEAATDLLSSPGSRVYATLKLYHYSKDARSLLDWAVAQTGVDDPLSHLTRHELEQEFETFALYRDRHLRKLVESLRKEGKQDLLHQDLHKLTPVVRNTVARALKGR